MKSNDKVKIMVRGFLEYEHFKALILLYRPIVGGEACSVYETLYYLVNMQKGVSLEYRVSFLTDLFGTTIKKFDEIREKLEALGLIRTYYLPNKTDGDEYVIRLDAPKNTREFKKDNLLLNTLSQNLKVPTIENVFDTFHLDYVILDNYRDISKCYSDIYEVTGVIPKKLYLKNNFRGLESSNDIKYEYAFEIEKFMDNLPKTVILKNGDLYLEDYQKGLLNISFIYKLNEEELAEIYIKASDKALRGKPTIEALSNQASIYYMEKNRTAEEPKAKEKEYDPDIFNMISPTDLVTIFSKGEALSAAELQSCEQFYFQNSNIERGVLATIVIYCHKLLNHIPAVGYMEKVLHSWINEYGILDTKSAIIYLTDIDKVRDKKPVKGKEEDRLKKQYGDDWLTKMQKDIKETQAGNNKYGGEDND